MKRLSWKYLAGLIDGEGCIDFQVIRKTYIQPRLRLAMATPGADVIRMCKNTYGGYVTDRPSKNPNWSDSQSWELVGYKQACPVLRNIVNHLFIKKEQARLILWMERNVKGQQVGAEVRDAVRDELRLMKRDPHRLSEQTQEIILGML